MPGSKPETSGIIASESVILRKETSANETENVAVQTGKEIIPISADPSKYSARYELLVSVK